MSIWHNQTVNHSKLGFVCGAFTCARDTEIGKTSLRNGKRNSRNPSSHGGPESVVRRPDEPEPELNFKHLELRDGMVVSRGNFFFSAPALCRQASDAKGTRSHYSTDSTSL